jgi:hypothetical protein
MEYTREFTNLRNNITIEYLKYKRQFLKNENELNLIDLKLTELTGSSINNVNSELDEHSEFLNKISGEFNKYSLFRPWNRLTKEQKNEQLKIYLENLINANNLEELKLVLLQYNEAGILTNKYIKYDSKIAKIVGIKTLEYNNNTNEYGFQINLKKTLSI